MFPIRFEVGTLNGVKFLLEKDRKETIHPLKFSNPVDPAGGHCYLSSTKPCKSNGNVGAKLSNT
jgi:hypothetical protein